MKVAVCVSGSLRQFKTCHPHLKEYFFGLEGVEYDFFLSTWDSKVPHEKVDFRDEGTFEELLDLYKPKKYNLEVYDDKKREELAELSGLNEYQKIRCADYTRQNNNLSYKDWVTGGTIAHNIVGMFYNIYQANKLKCEYEKEKGFKYDICMRLRFDGWVDNGNPITKKQLQDVKDGQIVVAKGRWNKAIHQPWRFGPDDKFAMGKSHDMDCYSSVFKDFRQIIDFYATQYGYFPITHGCIVRTCQIYDIAVATIKMAVDVYYKAITKITLGHGNIKENEFPWQGCPRDSAEYKRIQEEIGRIKNWSDVRKGV